MYSVGKKHEAVAVRSIKKIGNSETIAPFVTEMTRTRKEMAVQSVAAYKILHLSRYVRNSLSVVRNNNNNNNIRAIFLRNLKLGRRVVKVDTKP